MNFTNYFIVGLIVVIFLSSTLQKENSYDAFIAGAKDGIKLFVNILPTMLAMFLAITLTKSSGLMEVLSNILAPVLNIASVPSEVVPMFFFRPLSGGGSLAILVNIFKTLGPDSSAGIMGSIVQGSTETTLYVLSLYFGSVGITKTRHALKVGLMADAVGILMAVILTMLFY